VAAKRLLIADDDPKIREALRVMFRTEAWIEICGEARDGLEAAEKAEQLRPDMVILDWQMPKLNGVEAAEIISKELPGVSIIVFSMHSALGAHVDTYRAGISAMLDKNDPKILLETVRTLLGHITGACDTREEPPGFAKPER
jgi:DNA-binding NarL/FixJ family response regulator